MELFLSIDNNFVKYQIYAYNKRKVKTRKIDVCDRQITQAIKYCNNNNCKTENTRSLKR